MTMPTEENRFAPPQAHVEDVADVGSGRAVLAGRWERFGAALLDGLAVGVPLWLLLWVVSLVNGVPFAFQARRGFTMQLVVALAAIAIFAAINGRLLARQGQTVGKKIVGLRITAPDGSILPAGRVIGLRYGVGYLTILLPAIQLIYAIVDIVMIFRSNRRCLHDVIAGTIVVKA